MRLDLDFGPLELRLDARLRDAEREDALEREARRQNKNLLTILAGAAGAIVPLLIDAVNKRRYEEASCYDLPDDSLERRERNEAHSQHEEDDPAPDSSSGEDQN